MDSQTMNLDVPVLILAQAETPAADHENAAAGETAADHDAPAGTDHATPVSADAHGEAELHAGTEAHGGDHSGVFPPFDPSSFATQLIWLAITFGILYVVLSRVALPRIGGIIEDRKGRITADLARADTSRQQTDAAIAAYEAALAEARRKSQALAEETRAGIKADIDARRHAVETDLSHRMADAEARISATKSEALGHVDEIAADTVAAIVEQLAGPVSVEDARSAVAAVARG